MAVMDHKKITLVIEIIFFSLVLFVFGGPFGSPIRGDINSIDEGQFGAWAYQMLEGKILYKDIFSTYGPFYTYPLYMLFAIFGTDPFVLRIYLVSGTFIGGIASLAILYQLRISPFIRWLVLLSVSILPILTLRQSIGMIAILVMYYSQQKKSFLLAFFAGVTIGATFLVSPEIGIFVYIAIIFSLIIHKVVEKTFVHYFKTFICITGGILSVGAVFAFWASSEGWFLAYVNVTLDVFQSFSGITIPNGQGFPSFFSILENSTKVPIFLRILSKEGLLYIELMFYIASVFYVVARSFMYKISSKDSLVMYLTFFGVFLYSILLSRHGLGHFYFSLPPLVILLAYYVNVLAFRFVKGTTREKYVSLCLLCIIVIFSIRLFMIQRITIGEKVYSFFSERYAPIDQHSYLYVSLNQRQHIYRIQNIVNNKTTKDAYVFYLSDQPVMYLLTERLNPTRYDLPFVANTIEKRYEILSDLQKHKPDVILYDKQAWDVDEISNMRRLPEVMKFISENYIFTEYNDGIIVYTRKDI